MAISFRDLLKPSNVDDVEAAQRRAQIAEAMQQRYMRPNLPEIGGPVQQKYGVGNALVDLANSLAASYNAKVANDNLSAAQGKRQANVSAATKQLAGAVPDDMVGAMAASRIQSAPDGQLAEPTYGRSESQRRLANAMGPKGTDALAQAMLEQSLKTTDPELIATNELRRATLQGTREDRAAALEERRAAREQRMNELQMRLADARTAASERNALMRELAQLRADSAREIAAMRVDAEQGKNDAKLATAQEKQQNAKQAVSSLVGELNTLYGDLENGGGITSTESGPLANLAASVSASGVGQTVGGALGTKNQSARNTINSFRTRLVSAIMAATGMSAKQLDSNAELRLQLDSATSPQKDVQSNRRALQWIEQNYGIADPAGLAAAPTAPTAPAAPAAPAAGGGLTPAEQAELDALRARFGGRKQ